MGRGGKGVNKSETHSNQTYGTLITRKISINVKKKKIFRVCETNHKEKIISGNSKFFFQFKNPS